MGYITPEAFEQFHKDRKAKEREARHRNALKGRDQGGRFLAKKKA